MSNGNTIADAILLQNNGKPITMSSTGTLHAQFTSNGVVGGPVLQVTVPNPMALNVEAGLFPPRAANGLSFVVRAAGLITGGERYQVDVNLGSGLTQTIASTGLAINGLTADNWLIEAECMWDPTSLNLRGIQYGWAGLQAITQSALATAQQPANLAALTFCAAFTFSNANVNSAITLTDFSIDMN